MRLIIPLILLATVSALKAEWVLEYETKISDSALYFDGDKVADPLTAFDRTDGLYDYAFGPRINPDGDCIATYGEFIFLTWYKGGKNNRQVMLTRLHLPTKNQVTIEFPHQHNGYHNRSFIGESHNTIAVGISPIDETIHLLYDMHSYSSTRPSNGSLSEDYFRYSVSLPGVATMPDSSFKLNAFNPKRLYLKEGEDYTDKTYPTFINSDDGALYVSMREGGTENGAYQLAKYDGKAWSNWYNFNQLSARTNGLDYHWGPYGSFKYLDGKFRIGFATRKKIKTDPWVLNNGFHYAYSNAPDGDGDWYNFRNELIETPLVDPTQLLLVEPGKQVNYSDTSSVRIATSPEWSVTSNGSVHFVSNSVQGPDTTVNVHAFQGPKDTGFIVSTDFPGGNMVSIGDSVYLLALEDKQPVLYRTYAGTNEWEELYRSTGGTRFRFGNILENEGKIYYFGLVIGAGSAQPIHLQVFAPKITTTMKMDTVVTALYKNSVTIDTTFIGAVGKEDTLIKTTTFTVYRDSIFFINNTFSVGVWLNADTLFISTDLRNDTTNIKVNTLTYQDDVVAIRLSDDSFTSDISDLFVIPNSISQTAKRVHIIIPSELSGHWEIIVSDMLGYLVNEAEFDAAGETTYSWNLRNKQGVMVKNGSYFLIARFINKNGRVKTFRRIIRINK